MGTIISAHLKENTIVLQLLNMNLGSLELSISRVRSAVAEHLILVTYTQ